MDKRVKCLRCGRESVISERDLDILRVDNLRGAPPIPSEAELWCDSRRCSWHQRHRIMPVKVANARKRSRR